MPANLGLCKATPKANNCGQQAHHRISHKKEPEPRRTPAQNAGALTTGWVTGGEPLVRTWLVPTLAEGALLGKRHYVVLGKL